MITISDRHVSQLSIDFPECGAWTADCILVGAAPLSVGSACTLSLDGDEWQGTVNRWTTDAGRARALIVGSQGQFHLTPQSRSWGTSVTVRTVAQALCSAAGTQLAASSDSTVLSQRVEHWNVFSTEPIGPQLRNLLSLFGACWTVSRGGQVLIYQPSGELQPGQDWVKLTSAPGLSSWRVFATDRLPRPGTSYEGKRVTSTGVVLKDRQITFTVRFADEAINDTVRDRFSRLYPATVVSQDGDFFEVQPDDPTISGGGFSFLRYRLGLPGCRIVNTSPGTRCFIAFDEADGGKPFIAGFEFATGAARGAARLNDTVEVIMPLASFTATTSAGPITGQITTWTPTTAQGVITSAASKILIDGD